MFCTNCGVENNENAKFCLNCGIQLKCEKLDEEVHHINEEINKRPRKILLISTFLITLIMGISITVFYISKLPQNIIRDGYFLAVPEVNSYDLIDYEYGSDLGFIFADDKVFTTEQNVFNYSVNKDKIYIENIYRVEEETSTAPDGTGIIAASRAESEYVFSGYYDNENDCLVLTLTEYGYEFYDGKFDKDIEIVCKHYKDDEDSIPLEKMLYFDGWATIDYDYNIANHIDKVEYANTHNNNLLKDTLMSESDDIQIFDFYKNYKEFDYSEGNGKITYFDQNKECWVYKSMVFSLIGFYNEEIVVNQNGESEKRYYYDEEQDCLVSTMDETKIYRVANFTDYGN